MLLQIVGNQYDFFTLDLSYTCSFGVNQNYDMFFGLVPVMRWDKFLLDKWR